MTSIPASLNARATNFAPRSWPSRPGLAIRMRMRLLLEGKVGSPPVASGRAGRRPAARSLDDAVLAILAEDLSQGVADLAQRDIPVGARHDRRHQVVAARRRPPQPIEGRGGDAGVAASAEPLQPVDLLALEGRIDPQ